MKICGSKRKLLNFKDIHQNRYYIKTMTKDNLKYFYITYVISKQKKKKYIRQTLSILM